jgi:hypothetical protein
MFSALPPKADIAQRGQHVRLVPKRGSAPHQLLNLFDHLVGAAQQRRGYRDAERLRSFQIDD